MGWYAVAWGSVLGVWLWCCLVVFVYGLLLFELGFGYLVVDLCGFDC